MSEPASANMTPIAGKTTLSTPYPMVWKTTTRTIATARRTSKYTQRAVFMPATFFWRV
ncbi:hypothetical protein [Streptomyces sp. NPDC059928]|uniref:hypothetical protein n=1 Tax=unclassified Streptomyces TaxID=2593676 RepID=UPI003651A659